MSRRKYGFPALLMLVFLAFSGCSTTHQAKDFSGLSTPHGKAAHLNTTNIGVHFLFGTGQALAGDASLEKTVSDFTSAAKAMGAKQVRIVQSSRIALWFVFPPFSFLITPVITNVAGDAI